MRSRKTTGSWFVSKSFCRNSVASSAAKGNATPAAFTGLERLEVRRLMATQPVVSVNFQPASAPTVPGYVVDAGDTFGVRSSGFAYGWNTSHTTKVVDRQINADQRLDTNVSVQAGSRWELSVPNGRYTVSVGVGDAGSATTANVWVEGKSLISFQKLAANQFATKSITVDVADGKLTIGAGSAPSDTVKIDFVNVSKEAAPPAITVGTILPLGDSITWGYVDKQVSTGGYRRRLYENLKAKNAAFSYVGSVRDYYSKELIDAGHAKHEGHGGYRTDQLLGNLLANGQSTNVSSNNGGHWLDGTANHPAVNPDIVLLHIGTNDFIQNRSVASAAGNLDKIIQTITTARPKARLYVATIIPFNDPSKAATIKAYNQKVKELVAKYKTAGANVELVDVWAKFVNADGSTKSNLYSDTWHPTDAGYALIGDAWTTAILAHVPTAAAK